MNKVNLHASKYLEEIKPKIGKSIWSTLAPTSKNPARFHGLPKIHKPDITLRLIVDYTDYPTYHLSKHQSVIFKTLQRHVQRHLYNSSQFSNNLTAVTLGTDEIFINF